MYKTSLIKKPKKEDDQIRYADGLTQDIIETVLYADTKAAWYTQLFAPTLKKKTLPETCRNIWQFVKTQIPYKLDPAGEQWIKSPGRLWADKAGDCKSFSLFTGSCLRNLGIPYGYRFASYSSINPQATHVYVYVPLANGGEIILDSVWTGPFNTQKAYTFKQDKLMSRIAYLGGIGTATRKVAHTPTVFKLTKDIDKMSDGEMDLLLARQRLEIEKQNSAAVGGPFNWQIDKYDKAIGVIQSALDNIDNPNHIEGIGNTMLNNARYQGRTESVGGFFKKIGQGIKKGFKAVTKVLTLPLRLIAKGILEIYLPKAAMMFLYLFAEEKMLNTVMIAKRKKSEKFKNFIVKKIGMKEKHFMAIIRNSLTKSLQMSPESYMAKVMRNVAIKGIGNIGGPKKKGRKKKGTSAAAKPIVYAPLTDAQRNGVDHLFDKSYGGVVVKPKGKGNIISMVIGAISWIINKLGGKKEGIDIGADDIPDVGADAGGESTNGSIDNGSGDFDEGSYGSSQKTSSKKSSGKSAYSPGADDTIEDDNTESDGTQEQGLFENATKIKNQSADTLTDMENTGGRAAPGMCKC
jgi:hypothetical protein